MKKTWIIAGALAALALAGGGGYYYYTQTTQTTAAAVRTAVVERGNARSTVSATGTIKPLDSVEISSKITAYIKEIPVKENDFVTAGQTLVTLEDKDLETKLEQAKYKVTNTEAKYKRAAYLHSIGAKSDQDLEDALLEYQTAQTNLDSAQSNIDDTIIIAPMDGYVVGEPKSVGTLVAQGVNNPTVIMTLADLSKKQINAKIDETDIGRIRVGQKVEFTVDAYTGKTFTAQVATISQTDVDNSWSDTSGSSATVIYYNVLMDVDDPENLLKPAMTARVNVTVAEKENVLLAPLAALKTNEDGQYVIVVRPDGAMENRKVDVGVYSGDKVEISEGVEEGEVLSISYVKTAGGSSSSKSGGGHPSGIPR